MLAVEPVTALLALIALRLLSGGGVVKTKSKLKNIDKEKTMTIKPFSFNAKIIAATSAALRLHLDG